MAGAPRRRAVDDLPLHKGLVARFRLAVHREDLAQFGHAQSPVGRPGDDLRRRAARGLRTLFFNLIIVAVDDGRVSRTRGTNSVRLETSDGGRRGEGEFLRWTSTRRVRQSLYGGSLVMPEASLSSSSEANNARPFPRNPERTP